MAEKQACGDKIPKCRPVCPYCGAEMYGCFKLKDIDEYSYVCLCGAQSPSGDTEDEAYEMATKRFTGKDAENDEKP